MEAEKKQRSEKGCSGKKAEIVNKIPKLFKVTTSSEEECHESMGKKGLQSPIFGDVNHLSVISQSCLLP